MTEQERAPERDLEELEADAERVGEHIEEARDDWERKKADPAVPGAGGDPKSASGGDEPETTYPAKGDDDDLGGGLEEPLDTRDPGNEDL